jgi:pyruvate dehydrogenase E1 component beta subunit
MPRASYTSALNAALREEMARDERVFVLGEDVRDSIFGVTKGLVDEFGRERVRNTPISENTVVGTGLGASAVGMRPVVDLMAANFIYVAMDQIVNQAAKLRYMMGGSCAFPLTILMSTGVSGGAAAQHSDSVHPYVMNSGGVKVVLPSNPYDAKGIFKAAIRDPDPVVMLYHNSLGGERGEVPDEDYTVPIGRGRVLREGSDLTIAASGLMAKRALRAAGQLAEDGIEAEVVDPLTLHPLAIEVVLNSVRNTGRLLSVDEARRTCSAGSEITARVAEEAWDSLRAAPVTIAVPDLPIPFSPVLENEIVPSVARIAQAARAMVAAPARGLP